MEFIVLNKGNDVLNPVAKFNSGNADTARCRKFQPVCTRTTVGMMPQRDGSRI